LNENPDEMAALVRGFVGRFVCVPVERNWIRVGLGLMFAPRRVLTDVPSFESPSLLFKERLTLFPCLVRKAVLKGQFKKSPEGLFTFPRNG
jgi:hypothetical protein